VAQARRGGRATQAIGPDEAAVLARNREQQALVYGEPLGDLFGSVGERLGLTQARIASIVGLSPPMLSQLVSAHRVKIGNPVAVQRLQALVALGNQVAAGRVPLTGVEVRLADIAVQAAVVTQASTSGAVTSTAGAAQAVQALFRSVGSAEELLDAAAMIAERYPEIATMLRVYGTARTAEAVAHFEANAGML
jgi:hypothetical protein